MNRLSLLVVSTIVISSTGTWWAAGGPLNEYPDLLQDCTAQVVVSTPTVCPPPAVSTGPVTIKASSGDCYAIPYVNPNGTTPATKWVPCQ